MVPLRILHRDIRLLDIRLRRGMRLECSGTNLYIRHLRQTAPRFMTVDFGLELLPPQGFPIFEHHLNSLPILTRYFTTLWICDHFQYGGGLNPWFEGWTTLAYLAAKFPNFKYGNLVLSEGYRNPALLAKMAATLQYLSGGSNNIILGLGAGWDEEEYIAYGYRFPKYQERVARLEETIEIVRKLWDESPASYEGKYYRIKNARCEPRPKTKIPILVGGSGEAVLKVAAKLADAWNEKGRMHIFKPAYEKLRQACVDVGRDVRELTLTCVVEPSFPENPSDFKQNQRNTILGPNANDVVEELYSLANLGVSHFQVRVGDVRSLEVFCDRVIPCLKL